MPINSNALPDGAGLTDSEVIHLPTIRMKFLNCDVLTGPLTAVTESNCMVLLEQARRCGYQLLSPGTPLGDAATILAPGTHTAAMALSTDAKLVLPRNKFYAPELGGSEVVKVGSNDNATPEGISIVRGQSVPMFKAMLTGLSPAQYEAYENLFARGNASADFPTLGFYAYLGDRQFMCSKTFGPIPGKAYFIGDPTGMKLHDLTQAAIEFELNKGWFRDVQVLTLSFNHNTL